ncbi:hypothetical protein IZY60_05630 [Lutibacter sp. B2]|nr:hypothetical protein [Lutibacter sp. B2]
MSNEALIGILITVIFGVGAFLLTTKKYRLIFKPRTKNGNIDINNTTIGNEINKKNNK